MDNDRPDPSEVPPGTSISFTTLDGVVHFGEVAGPLMWDSKLSAWFLPISVTIVDTVSGPPRKAKFRAPVGSIELWPRTRALRDERFRRAPVVHRGTPAGSQQRAAG